MPKAVANHKPKAATPPSKPKAAAPPAKPKATTKPAVAAPAPKLKPAVPKEHKKGGVVEKKVKKVTQDESRPGMPAHWSLIQRKMGIF